MSGGQLSFYPEQAPPDPLLCWLWLAGTLGSACAHAGRVLDAFGGAQEAWEERDSQTFRRIAGPVAARRAVQPDHTPASYRALVQRCSRLGVRILPYDDPDYPLALSRIPDMPLVLYCTGDPGYLNAPCAVGMVGSRRPTAYGVDAAAVIGRGLARQGAVIVSGLADGLDGESHRAALDAGRPTIGVLGVPIDRTYPAANHALRQRIERCGCVISEYPPGSDGVGKAGFVQRNRLIAALSSALLVVEAKEKSGTMSTVAYAEQYGRPVFAVPGSIFAPSSGGTNQLLRSGRARAAVCPEDLLEALGLPAEPDAPEPAAPPRQTEPLSEAERRVLACIGPEPRGVEELTERSGLPTAALLSALMRLELAGRVIAQPGKRYILR